MRRLVIIAVLVTVALVVAADAIQACGLRNNARGFVSFGAGHWNGGYWNLCGSNCGCTSGYGLCCPTGPYGPYPAPYVPGFTPPTPPAPPVPPAGPAAGAAQPQGSALAPIPAPATPSPSDVAAPPAKKTPETAPPPLPGIKEDGTSKPEKPSVPPGLDVPPLDLPTIPVPEKKEAPAKKTTSIERLRLWSDVTGRHRVVARFAAVVEGGIVRLEKSDGTYVRIAIDQLSGADRTYLSARQPTLAAN